VKMVLKFKYAVRRLLFRSKLHYFLGPLSSVLVKVFYVSKFIEWCNLNPCSDFNDLSDNSFPDYRRRYDLYKHLVERENLSGEIDYLEFGVSGGDSLKYWLQQNKNPASRFFGFDTFLGLPENWGNENKGIFSRQGKIPDIQDSRCTFEVGLFQNTVCGFISRFPFHRKLVIHLDADLYSSTLFVLTSLAPKLKTGDIIIFDEFAAKDFMHEFRAFIDFTSAYQIKYKVVGAINIYMQVAIKIL
jgi:O-methyltransferase